MQLLDQGELILHSPQDCMIHQTVESTGINRAKALNSSLFRKYPDGKIFEIYLKKVDKNRRIKANMFRRCANNTTYIPGIQVDL